MVSQRVLLPVWSFHTGNTEHTAGIFRDIYEIILLLHDSGYIGRNKIYLQMQRY